MLNSIINGIAIALSNDFAGLDIYTEPVEQGIKKPCFEVVCEKVDSKQLLGNRFQYGTSFKITYHPSGSEPNSECLAQLEKLSVCLVAIQVEDIVVRARNISAEIIESKLVFSCDYNLIYFKVEDIDKMEILQNNTVKVEE